EIGLRAHRRKSRSLRRAGSFWRFRPAIWLRTSWSQDCRSPDSLSVADLWNDEHSALAQRRSPVADGCAGGETAEVLVTNSLRGASPLGLPCTLARGGPAIPAPLAWAHSRARSPAGPY